MQKIHMPVLTGSVGKGGNNWIHDVAVVQGALAAIPGPNRKPIWQGAIDGRKGKPVEDAIATFQAANRMPPTGRLNQSGTEANRLEQNLPQGYKAMRALRGTPVLWRFGAGASGQRKAAQRIKAEAPLPDEDRKALGDIVERIRRSSGLDLDIAEITAIPEGRFRVVLDAPGVEWFDPSRKQFRKDISPPDSALRGMHQATQGNPRWRKASANDGLLVLDSQQAISSLVGTPALEAEGRQSLGIAIQPKSKLARACLGACARMIKNGTHASGAGKADFDLLMLVADRAEPGVAKVPQQAEEYQIVDEEELFELALAAFEGEAIAWATSLEINSRARDWYINVIRENSKDVLRQYKAGLIDAQRAAEIAGNLRGEALEKAREKGTTFGKVLAEWLKRENLDLQKLQERYAGRKFYKEFDELLPDEKMQIWETIIERSGAGNTRVNMMTTVAKYGGRALFAATFAVAAYEIMEAENKEQEAIRQSAILSGGLAGGYVGAKAGLACLQFAWACSGALSFIFAVAGALGAEFAVDEILEED
jgi:hypothetical protein